MASAGTAADVTLDAVTKRFGPVLAVDGVSLDIEAGAFFSLLGSSGCGKTTTLRIVGGFEDPTSGVVRLGGSDVTGVPPNKRDVNTVFQEYALFPHLDVGGNVAFGLKRRKVDAKELRRRVGEALELVQLGGLERRRATQLSGGQKQRVALARALVNRPRVLLLDEPLGALDLKLRRQMQVELQRIHKEVGITFLYVTHDQEEAMTMSTELAVMRNGRVEQRGKPRDVYDRPASEFVAGFLGECNLLRGEVVSETTVHVRELDANVAVPPDRLANHKGAVLVGVRPENATLERAADDEPAGNRLEGELQLASFLGARHEYRVLLRGGAVFAVYIQSGEPPDVRVGDRVRVRWRPEHTIVLDPAAGGEPMSETDDRKE